MRTLPLFIALLLTPLVASAQPAAPAGAPEGSTAFTSEELESRLKGNSFSYSMDGTRKMRIDFKGNVAYRTYATPSGMQLSDSGPWQTKDSSFCITHSGQGQQCQQIRGAGTAMLIRFKSGWTAFQKE